MKATGKATIGVQGTARVDDKAYRVELVGFDAAHLPLPPERKPKDSGSTAGIVRFAALQTAEPVQITLSQAAWIDVVQDGHLVKASAFSGAHGCPGVRKSIRFPLAAAPFIVQISGTTEPSIDLVVSAVKP